MKLENKVAIITGGSRGIGYSTVEKFIKEGAKVCLTASSEMSVAKAVAKLEKDYPDADIMGIAPLLGSLESVKSEFAKVIRKHGRIDILINNAGMSESTPLSAYTEELYEKIMDLNVKGVFTCSKVAADYMEKQHGGVIINTSSVVSITGQPAGFAYPASKSAVNAMTLSMARELGPKGIRVNAVAPGITETDMMKAVPKEVIEPLIKTIPLRRIGQAEDIANAFAFLASDEASYITGIVLNVDGLARV